jgi:uncharacterized protein YdhG (YjbR/CyaY superfamily)
MKVEASSVENYFENITEERQEAMKKLWKVVSDNVPAKFEAVLSYGMPGYVVPHSVYPAGYHCNTKLPLPFMSIASQKNFVAFYHMGIYAKPELLKWFVDEYPKHVKTKLDMGKSCIRFKKVESIPYELLGELMTKMTANQWIETYENAFRN